MLGEGQPRREAELLACSAVEQLIEEINRLSPQGSINDGNLASFLAESGLLPMYGMPTRVRDLYVGIESNDLGEPDWDTIDREMDLAIYEFAPGPSLVRDKRKHTSIGSLLHWVRFVSTGKKTQHSSHRCAALFGTQIRPTSRPVRNAARQILRRFMRPSAAATAENRSHWRPLNSTICRQHSEQRSSRPPGQSTENSRDKWTTS